MRFDGTCIITDNVAGMRAFYSDVLRVESDGDDNYAVLLGDDVKLSIFPKAGMEVMAPGCMRETGCGSCAIEIEVDDVDAEYELLKKKKVVVVKPPTTQPWGVRSVWFRDPDGNIVNFHANVK